VNYGGIMYKVRVIHRHRDEKELETTINELGNNGYELDFIYHDKFIFKKIDDTGRQYKKRTSKES